MVCRQITAKRPGLFTRAVGRPYLAGRSLPTSAGMSFNASATALRISSCCALRLAARACRLAHSHSAQHGPTGFMYNQ